MNSLVTIFLVIFLCNCAAMVIFYRVLRSRFSANRVLKDVRVEVDKLIIDLGRETDRDVAILESRIKNLRELIDEADRRILVSNREGVKREREKAIINDALGTPVPVTIDGMGREASAQPIPQPSVPPFSAKPTSTQAPLPSRNEPASDRPPAEQAVPKRETDTTPVTIYTRPIIRRNENPIEPFVPVRERALDMARKGFTAPMIASTLSMSLGEVELILDMNSSSL
jgi:hypothetical protein